MLVPYTLVALFERIENPMRGICLEANAIGLHLYLYLYLYLNYCQIGQARQKSNLTVR